MTSPAELNATSDAVLNHFVSAVIKGRKTPDKLGNILTLGLLLRINNLGALRESERAQPEHAA